VLDADQPVPVLSVATTFLLGATSLVAILAFITHMFRMVRVDTMMLRVHDDTTHAIDLFYPPYGNESPPVPEGALTGIPTTVTADRSGFVQAIEVGDLVDAARSRGAFVRVVSGPPCTSTTRERSGRWSPIATCATTSISCADSSDGSVRRNPPCSARSSGGCATWRRRAGTTTSATRSVAPPS
jgi:hypothetical protein